MRPSAAERAVLEDVARRFGQQDPVAEALAGGLGNRSWRLCDASRDLVVRIGAPHAAAFGVSRRDEALAQSVAAARGLAPPVLWHDAATGLLVTEFVAGRSWSRHEARQPAAAARCGAWLRSLHDVPPPAGIASVDFCERAARLGGALPKGLLPARLQEQAARQCHRLGKAAAPVLCHNDLHHLNIIDNGSQLTVLDWEYAGAGAAPMDLAGYAAYHELGEPATQALLGAYAAGAPGMAAGPFAAARWLFEFVWLLWLETLRVTAGHESADLAATRRRLAARLENVHGE